LPQGEEALERQALRQPDLRLGLDGVGLAAAYLCELNRRQRSTADAFVYRMWFIQSTDCNLHRELWRRRPRLACLMGKSITALVAQKKNKDRVSVYLDGRFAFGLAAIEAVKLKRGQVLSDEDIARLLDADAVEKAHERALHFLSFRPRSESEVRRNLSDAKHTAETIEAAIHRLKRAGLVDDRAFAQYWLENRGQFSPRSSRALKVELRRKGVPVEMIDEVLEAASHSDASAALQAARSKARRMARFGNKEIKQKLVVYLVRRGFDYEVALEAAGRAWEEAAAQGES